VSVAGQLAEARFSREMGWLPPPQWSFHSDHARQSRCAVALSRDEDVMRKDIEKRVTRALADERIWRQVIGVAAALFASWSNAKGSSDGTTEINDAMLREIVAMGA
jgi:hypothetical protein